MDLGPSALRDDRPPPVGEFSAPVERVDAEDADGDGGDATHTISPGNALAAARDRDLVHGLPTQQLTASASRKGDSQHSRFSTAVSPVEALKQDEVARTKVFCKVAFATSVMGVVAAFVTGGDPIAFRCVLVGCLLTLTGAGWILRLSRDAKDYNPQALRAPVLALTLGAFGGIYYWGVGSPVAAMFVYGLYFFALGGSGRLITAVYILITVIHGALGVLIMAGVIADRGIVSIAGLRPLDQLGVILVCEFLYLVTYVTARASQRVTLDAVTKLEQAVRNVVQRDALLAEARAELDRALKIGGPGRFTDQVVGSFRLGVLIGRGGMGEVYEAHSVTDQREAAIKLLHPGTLGDPTHVARFLREAHVASLIQCAHVVRVLEVGTTTGEVPFIAMERLRGHDLAHHLRRARRMTLAHAERLLGEIAVGLEAARGAHIVHRDLKPHNVFHAEQPDGTRVWKILDFGVGKAGGTGTLTKGHVVGTPAYMAPEQARGEDVDHRADVYSLAAIIYRGITGHPAFTGKDVPSTLYDVVYRVPTQPSMLTSLPADVDRVLALGLAKDPRDRLATATEMAAWFSAAIGERGLAPDQRARADDLIQRAPWGTRQGVTTSGGVR